MGCRTNTPRLTSPSVPAPPPLSPHAGQQAPSRSLPGQGDLESRSLSLKNWSSRRPGRVLLVSGWAHQAALKDGPDLCVDMRDSELQPREAEELASLMLRCPRLTSLDVRGNNSIGAVGVAALRRASKGMFAADSKPRSLCGLAPDRSTLTVVKELGVFEAMLIAVELESATFAESQAALQGTSKGPAQLRRSAQASSVTGEVWSPLMWCVKDNNAALVRQFLRDGADANQRDSKLYQEYTPLHWAAMRGHREAAQVLLENGADPRLKCLRGHTARVLAEKNKDAKFVALLDANVAGAGNAASVANANAAASLSTDRPPPTVSPPARGGATARAIPDTSPSQLRTSRAGPSRD